MPKNLIFTDREAAFLKELAKNKVAFMIVGLSAACLQGAPVVTQDIDLWFRNLGDPKIKKVLKKVGGIYVPPFNLNPPMFAGPHFEMFDIVLNMDGLGPFQKEIKNTIEVPLGKYKIKILSLERILKSKTAAKREKDKLSLAVLKDTLSAAQSLRSKVSEKKKRKK